ncbi:MAG: hypothetical protein HC799_08505 [Limnothrix sp. RL_2_0]|nr:hypothetical protein [Limnothrix sp. RL_2_0]
MRFSSVAYCTISALLGSGMAVQANDGINEHQPDDLDLNQQPDLEHSHPSEKYQVSRAITPALASRIVPPEASFSSHNFESRQSRLGSQNRPVEIAAIAPRSNRLIDQAAAEITPDSDSFISEFEWTADQDSESAIKPSSQALEITPSTAAIALEAAPSFEEKTNDQLAVVEGDQTTILLAENRIPTIVKNTENSRSEAIAVDSEDTSTQQVFSPSLADFMAVESEAIAKLRDESTMPTANTPSDSNYLISQNSQTLNCDSCTPVEPLVLPEVNQGVGPALSINIPVGFGADQNTVFLSSSYQAITRDKGDGSTGPSFHTGIGVGLGNASETVGVELSYALDTNDNFGDGGFNAKLHKRFTPDFAGSIGWNGFLNTSRHDFQHSLYGSLTKVFRTRESLDQAFSRVAVTAGLGSNQFRSNGAVNAGEDSVNVFGNVAVRVAKPVSFITEWTGQDLGVGLSIAPFKNLPLVITPALRDVFGNRESRFVLGVGIAKKF